MDFTRTDMNGFTNFIRSWKVYILKSLSGPTAFIILFPKLSCFSMSMTWFCWEKIKSKFLKLQCTKTKLDIKVLGKTVKLLGVNFDNLKMVFLFSRWITLKIFMSNLKVIIHLLFLYPFQKITFLKGTIPSNKWRNSAF